MALRLVCHECGKILYEGRDMIPIYMLRKRTEEKCPSCNRKLSIEPLKIIYEKTDGANFGLQKNLNGPWFCSWNCLFQSYDIQKVIIHENKEH